MQQIGKIQILKVKVTNENKIHIKYEKLNSDGGYDEFSLTCAAVPKDSFYETLQNLRYELVSICELPEETNEQMIMTGVVFTHNSKDDTMGVTFIGQKVLSDMDVNLNLVTPHINGVETGTDFYSKVKLLEIECIAYIKGDRKQRNMFMENDLEMEVHEKQFMV